MQSFQSPFRLGAKVMIDGSDSIVGTVIAVCFQEHIAEIKVAWWNCGDLRESWIAASRLSEVTKCPSP